MKEYKKIHIIGRAGSGKTYTSQKISEILNINSIELDTLFWDKSDKTFSRRAIVEIRDRELNDLLSNDSWIMEGVYHEWLAESFQKADLIIFLKSSFLHSTFRIIIRFIKEKVRIIQHDKKETFGGLIKIIKRNMLYHDVYTNEISKLLIPHKDKLQYFDKGDFAITYIKVKNR